MTATLKALGIDRLSVDERILLAEEIWDSIEEETDDFPLTEAQKSELQRRMDYCDAHPNSGSSWEDVKARLRARS